MLRVQILLYAVFALGLSVLVGYAGLVSLGHAGLFGLACYGLAYVLAAGHSHAVAIIVALCITVVGTAVFAALSLRATGIGFIMITLALGEILWGLAYRWISITNGDNGISVASRPSPFGFSLASAAGFYYLTLIIFLLAIAAVFTFVRSPFGAALTGTRDQPRRMNALGYHVWMISFLGMSILRIAHRRGRHSFRLLQPVHQPADFGADLLGGGSSDGHIRRSEHALGPDIRGRAGCDREKRGERLYRALEFDVGGNFRCDRHLHARRPGSRHRATMADGIGCITRQANCAVEKRRAAAMTALAVKHLCKAFGGLHVASDINLVVEPGERRLIIGPNGAGKTTLFNLIMGELRPDSGSIHLFDDDITALPARGRPHLGMTRTYQIITLFEKDTIERNVTLALLGLSGLRWNPLVALHRKAHLVNRARSALARVGLDRIADRPLSQTSYGERRRVEIAMALAQNPRVLLLDEPFAGLSVDERQTFTIS